MRKKIVEYIKNINKKSENERIRIMWISVSFCMVLIVSVWIAVFLLSRPSTNKDKQFIPLFSVPENSLDEIGKLKEQMNVSLNPSDDKKQEEMNGIAMDYIKSNDLIKEDDISNLKLKRVEKIGDKWNISYEQYYKDILVNESDISLLMKEPKMNVILYESNFDSNIKIDVEEVISAHKAYDFLTKETKRNSLLLEESNLVIYRDISGEKVKHYLAWKISVYFGYAPHNKYNYFVNAKNGKIILYYTIEND